MKTLRPSNIHRLDCTPKVESFQDRKALQALLSALRRAGLNDAVDSLEQAVLRAGSSPGAQASPQAGTDDDGTGSSKWEVFLTVRMLP